MLYVLLDLAYLLEIIDIPPRIEFSIKLYMSMSVSSNFSSDILRAASHANPGAV